ncbi:MAG: SMC family ATPase [Chloroflexota bacterium]|nr:SMC family ATPase [Chloroflexota bacterium]
MIPLKLRLHNFMCYRDPDPLDFSGLHLACLSGNNGHGKSALLDAITWVLWGKARSNQPDALIHLGQKEMQVDYEFALGDNRYRVVRSRELRGKTGKSDLQLQVWVADKEEYRAITEPTIRQTEQRIVDLLRMDYDTFINSAFLVQGRADEFTVKPPGQRKQILADILGLDIYDDYENRAKDRVRQYKDEASRLDAQIAAIDEEGAHEAQYQSELQQAQGEALNFSEMLREAEKRQKDLHNRRQELLADQKTLADLQSRLQHGERELNEIEDQLEVANNRLVADQNLTARAAEIEAGYETLQSLRKADQGWNKKLGRQVDLQGQQSQLEREIDTVRGRLEGDQRVLRARATQLEEQAEQESTLEEQLKETRAELTRLTDLDAQKTQVQAEIQQLREELAGRQNENKQLRVEMDDVKEKLDILAEAGASCPICSQPLGAGEREKVLADYQSQGDTLGDRHRSNQARIQEIKNQVEEGNKQVGEFDQALKLRERWRRQEGQIENNLAQAQQARADVADTRQKLEAVTTQLDSGRYAEESQMALAAVLEELALLGYDPGAHDQVRADLIEYGAFEDRYQQLRAAQKRLDDLTEQIGRLRDQHSRWKGVLGDDRAKRGQLQKAVGDLPEVDKKLRTCTREVDQLAANERNARLRLGAAQQRLDACRKLAGQRKELAGQLQHILDQQVLYEELQAAFGKKGLQAMIIEAAIPEIEMEANRLLNRMTDGRMAVRMETQRETKSTQELRETLDIILSDELGSRDYSLYSGGEAYRANFAIRIALSKLLARRAGARLQTLIIDEGFGTQDAQGRERLVQAITSIQDDFERILVITHIDELKDQFPTRIDVQKTEEGSQIFLN